MAEGLPMFAFDISTQVLSVTPQDTAVILDAAYSTGLGQDDYTPLLIRAFAKVLGNPLASSMSKSQFDAAMRELLPEVAEWSDERKEQMSYLLSHIFYALDREGLESVPTDELLVALSFLCGGNKTAKLAFAFALFDANGEDAIEQAELARLISALLTALFALCGPSNETMDEAATDNAVHQCAVRTALDIFSDLGVEDESPLTFEQFGAWYNQFGFESIQWLELLDLRKWPGAAAHQGQESGVPSSDVPNNPTKTDATPPPPAQSPKADSGDGADGEIASIISFDFPAPTSAKVSITEQDVHRFEQILNLTDIHKVEPAEASSVILSAADEGVLDRTAFESCLRKLVPFEQLIAEAGFDAKEALQVVEELTSRFCCFFDAFERHPGHGAAADELAAGFALLCSGSKSEKLAHAWEIVASSGGAGSAASGRLSRRGLWRFLRGFLQMLMAVSQAAVKGLGAGELGATADSGAVWTAAMVFNESTALRSAEHSISFDEFAEWYTSGGFKSASWFELLDLKKWVMAPPVAEKEDDDEYDSDDDSDFIPSSDEGEDEEEDSDADEDEDNKEEGDEAGEGTHLDYANKIMFSFQLTEAGHALFVTEADAGSVLRLVSLSSLNKLTCEDVANALGAYAVPDPSSPPSKRQISGGGDMPSSPLVVPMDGYNSALRLLLPDVGEISADSSLRFLTTALANVFFAFSAGKEHAELDALTTGLSLFVSGSKSVKLQHSFSLFDADGDELLSGAELHRFLSSILTVLFACARQTARLDPDFSRALVDISAELLTSRIMRDTAGSVSFEEFGAWYNFEGCEVAPWLELLDLTKWQLSTASAPKTTASSGGVGLNPNAQEFKPPDQEGWGDALEDDDDDDDEDDDGEDEVDSDDSLDSDDYGYQGPKQNFKPEDDDESESERDKKATADAHNAMYGTGEVNARFSFALLDNTGEPSGFTLRLSDADVESLRALVTRTGLASMPVQVVCGPFLEAAEDGLLDKRSFDACVRKLIPSARLSADERTSFSVLLSAIYYNFEATTEATTPRGGVASFEDSEDFSDSANALELAMGLSLLCHGDKSSKLNYAWQVIDVDDDGLLNRAELLFFLRSFVRMLISLSFEASELSTAECRRFATDMASWLASTVMGRYADPHSGLVSFDGFAMWYHDGFHQVAPWLELLDLNKWVLV